MTDIAIERAAARDGGNGATPRDGVDGGPPRDGPRPAGDEHRRAAGMDPLFGIRTADIEPYTGLRYLSKLFRMIAVVLVLLLVAEVVTGIVRDGAEAITTLLAEVSRLIVLAGLLWGAGDLAILLIDVGHDVRAARILIARQTSHLTHPGSPSGPHPVPPGAGAGAGVARPALDRALVDGPRAVGVRAEGPLG
jgi:hypothetical protein